MSSYGPALYSLILPIAYLTLLIGSLATFSSLYRRRQAAKQASLAPWFGPHLQRNVYLSLLELQANPTATSSVASPSSTNSETDQSSPKIPDTLLKAALFRRAIEDVHRLLALRNQKPALAQLLQRGSVGDELMQRLQMAEKEMELEIKDVVTEANALAPQQQWGNIIFQSASEAAHREMLVRKLKAVEDTRPLMKEEWERRREGVRLGFMKELEEDSKAGSAEKKTQQLQQQPQNVGGSSDEDAPVIVEAGGPGDEESRVSAEDAGGSTKKKKKGKK